MTDHGSPTVRRRRLAAELRRLREQAGLTGEQVAASLSWSVAKVSRYELARTGLKTTDVASLLDLYMVGDERRELILGLASEALRQSWWKAYGDVLPETLSMQIGLEAEARMQREWRVETIPALLQVEEYAAALIQARLKHKHPPSIIRRRVEAHLKRQQTLTGDPPISLLVLVDESALLRQVADRHVMLAQLDHLGEISQTDNVTLRVSPLIGNRSFERGSFTILQFSQDGAAVMPDVVCLDTTGEGIDFIEDESDSYDYLIAFERLEESCLEKAESRQLIAQIAQERWL
jgi:transcriptional regulator with XRE-family HTH domain